MAHMAHMAPALQIQDLTRAMSDAQLALIGNAVRHVVPCGAMCGLPHGAP